MVNSMQWSIATCSLGGSLEEKLIAIAQAGFQAVEIYEEDIAGFMGTSKELRALAEDLGLKIVALQPIRDYEAMPEPHRTQNRERSERWFDLMEELGVNLTYVCSNTSPLAIKDPELIAADLYELAERASKRGIRVGYEALSWARWVKDWPQAWEIVRKVGHPFLGIVLDSFHCFVRRNPVQDISHLPPEKIFLVQLSDAPQLEMDPKALSRHHRVMPGQGDWEIKNFVYSILASGYNGVFSLEIFNEWLREAPPAFVAEDGIRSLKYLFDQLGLLVPSLPQGGRVQDFAFIEIVAEEDDLRELKFLLDTLGFRPECRHPVLEDELWSSGKARILLRLFDDESTSSREAPSIVGMGIEVGSSSSLAARTRELGLTLLTKNSGTGFLGVEWVGGTKLYFCDLAVEGIYGFPNLHLGLHCTRSSRGIERGSRHSPSITRVDHLTNIVPRWELYHWILIYKALLAFEVDAPVEIFDPYGLFYSRSLRSRGSLVRIALNTTEGLRTHTSHFLRSLGHAGIEHVAFLTDDIFHLAELSTKNGLPTLRIPSSYYRVLPARFNLPSHEVERLEAFNILYDKTLDGGEFFHFYTSSVGGRFFFEVVERRKGYAGYGAVNTAIRVNAQLYDVRFREKESSPNERLV